MFVSYFPRPKLFFISAAVWALVAVLAWFFFFKNFGVHVGLPDPAPDAPPVIGVSVFITPPFDDRSNPRRRHDDSPYTSVGVSS